MNWRILALLASGHWVVEVNTGALPAFLPFIKEALELSYTMTALIILTFNVTSSVIQPALGFIADRFSGRWLLPAGVIIAPFGLALIGFSPSYYWLLIFVAISGLGQAVYHPEGFKMVSVVSGSKKATGTSLFQLGGNFGFAISPILATYLYTIWGLKGSLLFVLPGFIMLAIFLVTYGWMVKTIPNPRGLGLGNENSLQNRVYPMVLLLLVVVLRSGARLALITFLPFYFIKILNYEPTAAGKYLSLFLLLGTVGIVTGGPLADRFGYKPTVLLSLVMTSVSLYLFYNTNGLLSLLFFSIAGYLIILSSSTTIVMGQSFMPNNIAMASGLVQGLAMGIGGIGTTVLGWIADLWGLSLALQVTFILPLLAFVVFCFIPYRSPSELPAPHSTLRPFSVK